MRALVVIAAVGWSAGCAALSSLDDLAVRAGPLEDAGLETAHDRPAGEDAGDEALPSGTSSGAVPPVADAGVPDAKAGDAGDGGTGNPVRATPVLVQSKGITKSGVTSVSLTILPTHAGSTVILGIGFDTKNDVTVTSITDDAGNTYVSAGYRAADISCTESAEIWYAKNVHAGATTVTVNNGSTGVLTETWLMEFSGLSTTNPLVTGAVASNAAAATVATAPQVAAPGPGAVVVSTAITCNDVQGIHAGNPFVDLASENTEFTAYAISTAAAKLGAVWDTENGTYCASSVVFY